ncbi:MAG: hypothetical protein EXQ97_07110 [Alphaproteobacteria bacterium]|nr:hypothetical protein [Alphaproteobacteria bacterium]
MRSEPVVAGLARGAALALARIVFADGPASGALVLAATALLAPAAAAGAFAGAVVGTLVAWWRDRDSARWRDGLAGYNAAILGMIWGGPLARGGDPAFLFVLFLAICLAIEAPLERLFARLALPPFAAAALLGGWLSELVFRAFGERFWEHPGLLPFGEAGVVAAVLCVAAAVALTSPRAAAAGATAALAAALAGGVATSAGSFADLALAQAGLWAFAVAPAAVGTHVSLPRGSALALGAGALAAIVTASVWLAWTAAPAGLLLPAPLMAPLFVGIWLATVLATCGHPLARDPALWPSAAALRAARSDGRPVVALTGAGISTASGIPDYTGGAWLEPGVPVSEFGFARFLAAPAARRLYWSACHRFREVAAAAGPNPAHAALAALEDAGFVAATVTQNVDGLHQQAGSRNVVELHGSIGHVRCLACAWEGPWPIYNAWQLRDILCPACGGLVKPAVIALGEDVPLAAWAAAVAAVDRGGVLLVVGSQLAVSSAHALVERARAAGARIVVVNLGPLATPPGPGDQFVAAPAERALPALAILLGVRRHPGAASAAGPATAGRP